MRLTEWARQQGVSYKTALEWFKAGKLPVPARRLVTGQIMVEDPQSLIEDSALYGRTVIYVRVSSEDQKSDPARLAQRLTDVAREQGWTNVEVVIEIVSGPRNGQRKVLRVRSCHDEAPLCAEENVSE